MSSADILQHRRAETARKLAYFMVGLLAGVILLNYICLMVLLGFNQAAETKELETVFNVVLPVVSGLAGSAATYYFTRENR